jgi:hypothetical protein
MNTKDELRLAFKELEEGIYQVRAFGWLEPSAG